MKKPLLDELTSEEKDILLPILIKIFKEKTNDKIHLTGDRIVRWFCNKKDAIGYKRAFNSQRFMKLTNYIRVNGLLPLLSSNDGYYVSRNKDEIVSMIVSFRGRIASQQAALDGLIAILKEIESEESEDLFNIDLSVNFK